MNFGSQRFGRELLRAQPLSTPHPAPISSGPKSGSQASPDARQRTIRVFTIAAALVAVALLVTIPAHAQSRRPRRESNANRKARIARADRGDLLPSLGGRRRRRLPPLPLRRIPPEEQRDHLLDQHHLLPQPQARHHRRDPRRLRQRQGRQHHLRHQFNPQISEYPFMGGATYRLHATRRPPSAPSPWAA